MEEKPTTKVHTVSTRENIGFLQNKKDWVHQPAVYTAHTLRINGHPVMEDWELNYMNMLAEIATSNGGDIIEVGYGMGLSAKAIQSHPIKSHTIIECHPAVIAKCAEDMRDGIAENGVRLLGGFWEDVTPELKDESADGIFFDTYPLSKEEIHKNHFWFFEEAYRLLKPGGILTYYSDEENDFSTEHLEKLIQAGFKRENISFKVCEVNPPVGCEYWTAKTMIAPIIRK